MHDAGRVQRLQRGNQLSDDLVLQTCRRHRLGYLAGVIPRHRQAIGSRRRHLNAGQQALRVLAYLRTGETLTALAAGAGVGTTTM